MSHIISNTEAIGYVACINIFRRSKKQEVHAENRENVIYEVDASFVVTNNDTAMFRHNGTDSADDDATNRMNPGSSDSTYSFAEQTDGGTVAKVMKENILYGTR